jgi:hypothetical protein
MTSPTRSRREGPHFELPFDNCRAPAAVGRVWSTASAGGRGSQCSQMADNQRSPAPFDITPRMSQPDPRQSATGSPSQRPCPGRRPGPPCTRRHLAIARVTAPTRQDGDGCVPRDRVAQPVCPALPLAVNRTTPPPRPTDPCSFHQWRSIATGAVGFPSCLRSKHVNRTQ